MKVAIRINETHEGFQASCPALPGCVEYGRTREEAIERIAQAVNGYFASMNSQQPVKIISADKQEVFAQSS
ncbi:MAG: type II toxin-antitoxin system HicB family antitoxin [Phycisphaerae bacterium]